MPFKSLVTCIAAVALTVTPTLATAQIAVPATAAQPAVEEVDGSELRGLRRGNTLTLLLLVAAAILLAFIAVNLAEDDDRPASP